MKIQKKIFLRGGVGGGGQWEGSGWGGGVRVDVNEMKIQKKNWGGVGGGVVGGSGSGWGSEWM